jgi:uncharacterized protein YecE (DUF72 family)
MDIWIGTSGYSYPDWVGDFYPPGTRPEKMLGHYCTSFPLVELNFTFYRPPTRAMLARLAEKTPAGFQFLVKVPQSLSHEQSTRDLDPFRDAVSELQRRNQLMGLLCQFPQATHCERKNIDWLLTLGRELAGLHPAVEFRHHSWARPGLPAWLAENQLDLVAVDVPGLPVLFPRGWKQSTRRAYVRLHSRNAAKWYASDKERYDYAYSDEALREWVGDLNAAREQTDQALLLFNNCHRGQATVNARRLRTLLQEEAPHLHVVETFISTPVQGELFS